MTRKLKICIFSELAYSSLTGEGVRGGAELQMKLLAKELVKRSYDVSFVTFYKSIKSYEIYEGMEVYNPFDSRDSGYTYLNPINLYKLFKMLKKIDADIYIQRATTPLTGILSFFAKIKNITFLYSVSSDHDVSTDLLIKSIRDLKKIPFRFGVKNCDSVLCQTEHQKKLLTQTLGKTGIVMNSLYLCPPIQHHQKEITSKKILWIGRIDTEKRPQLFLELAKHFPQNTFLMIGHQSPIDPQHYHHIKKIADTMNNVDFLGYIPHDTINKYYSESSIFISTSRSEGFPNTFIEAWGNFLPVVSLGFDPDGILQKEKLGFYAETFQEMVQYVKLLLTDETLRIKLGVNSRRYIEEKYNIEKTINKYEEIFQCLSQMKK